MRTTVLLSSLTVNAPAPPSSGDGLAPYRDPVLAMQQATAHIVPAVHGFFRSISLGRGQRQRVKSSVVLQDILRLLTLWFAHGARPEVHEALAHGFERLPVETWLDVVPQRVLTVRRGRAVQVFFSLTRLRNRNAPPLLAFVPLTVRGGKALKHEPLATLWLTVDDENDNE